MTTAFGWPRLHDNNVPSVASKLEYSNFNFWYLWCARKYVVTLLSLFAVHHFHFVFGGSFGSYGVNPWHSILFCFVWQFKLSLHIFAMQTEISA
ncbi:hypothetical protein F4821DRAFT_174493 [Hypoxylon rubiginosum]|uniref:Uncharacterized protein n=1 Tax=Hypoxylon rubiginosum TaxID=110542 RepID=A0ACC0DGP8_9PEZI|nr:hypothetical protein F4821DRAFT_174493 [Hypoxylon rubiginosum]